MMSGESIYQPQSAFMKWLERRLPIASLAHSSFIAYPTPRNLNYWWTFGGILTFMLGVQIVTGIVLAMHYTPHVDFAFNSVEGIMRDVNYGWLLRYMHANGASMFFLAAYIHMGRGLYYGSYKDPREVLWILGVILFLLMVITGFMGYVLPWGQMSFWAATVITNLFSAIPVVGSSIVTWLWGGFAVGNPTLNRFYSLHYLLPFVIVGVVGLHIWALHMVGQNNPTGVEPKSDKDVVAFTPYATVKDAFFVGVFCIVYAWFIFYIPNYLQHSDNYIPANPGQTPTHIVPEWYYLPFYAILRAIPNKLLGVIALFASIVLLAFLPWLDRCTDSYRRRAGDALHSACRLCLQFRRVDHARRELRLAAALSACQWRFVLFRRGLRPHRAQHVLRLLQGSARGVVDPRRYPVPLDGGHGLHGLRAALRPDELLGGDRHHQSVLGHSVGRRSDRHLAVGRLCGRQSNAEPLLFAALPVAVCHRRRRRSAHLGAACRRAKQPNRRRGEGQEGHGGVHTLRDHQGPLLHRRVLLVLRLVCFLHPQLSRPFR